MRTTTAVAPDAPGRLGDPVEPGELLRYLADLQEWRDHRRHELDELDAAALASPEAAALTADVTLAMALWQAVAERHDELLRVWDSGRAGRVELRRLADLVWGRLDADAGTDADRLAVSLPEACRLSDALAGQLRRRLSLDAVGTDLVAHLRTLRASVERLRDLVGAEPAGQARSAAAARFDALDRRLLDVTERARRGADVGGLLGPLEEDAARAERDLIVGAATRRDDARDRERAQGLRAELAARAREVGRLADACAGRVAPAPRLAVPRVEALGPVPQDAAAVDAYLDRLDAVGRAMALAERAYRAPLAELDALDDLLEVYRAKAASTGRAARPEVAEVYRLSREVLDEVPVELPRARAVVAAYRALLADDPPSPVTSGRAS